MEQSAHNNYRKGQALVEAVISLALGAILVAIAAATIAVVLRANVESRHFQAASALAQELWAAFRAAGEADWQTVDGLNGDYHFAVSGGRIVIDASTAGPETVAVDGTDYVRKVSLASVSGDPSQKSAAVRVEWVKGGQTFSLQMDGFLMRGRNAVFRETDWSAGPKAPAEVVARPNSYFFSSDENLDFSTTTGAIRVKGY